MEQREYDTEIKAVSYVHKQWPKLIVCVADRCLRIDKNLTENAIRPFVISRNNYPSAVYSIIKSVRRT